MMDSRPIILTLVHCYLPGYKAGGPVRSIANLVERLGDEFDFRIITSDRDLGDTEAYRGVVIDQWIRVGHAQVFYLSPRRRSIWGLVQVIRETPHDVLYMNSFFDPLFGMVPVLARRLGIIRGRSAVVAPRGEFSRGALALKAWKKRPYIALARMLGLYQGLIWQASSDHEMEDVQLALGKNTRVIVAENVPAAANRGCSDSPPTLELSESADERRLRVAFVSRIARKKNLDFALRTLALVTEPVDMTIYGTIEDDAFWRECLRLIDAMGSHLNVQYGGVLPHEAVVKTLSEYDLFFFPTRGENYGHVIYEALAAGLPVLVSDQTPWRDLDQLGIGWDLPLSDPQSFVDAINKQARLSDNERFGQRLQAIEYASKIATDDSIVASNAALFRECALLR